MEKLDNLHLVIYNYSDVLVYQIWHFLSDCLGICHYFSSFVIGNIPYLDVASVYEQQPKLKTMYLSFAWSLLEPHPSKPVEEEASKNAHNNSHFCLFSHVPHAYIII